ncbi:MAG: hypothetical protein AB7Q17_00685 [Phycisphaerae bacterium]
MKRSVIAVTTLVLLALSAGCDETTFGPLAGVLDAKLSLAKPIQLQDQDRLRLHLMDGSGDGSQYQFGGFNGSGGADGSGDGDQQRDQRRDGSCGDGG